MNHLQVSLENVKHHRQVKPAKNSDSIQSPSINFPFEISRSSIRNYAEHFNEESPPGDNESLAYIKRCQEQISQNELFGETYVLEYLNDQRRRCCRPGTIKNSYINLLILIKYLKKTGRACFEAIGRDDVSGFIEYEQDRGLKPRSICTILRTVYAFLGYLAEKDVVSSDLLKKKLRIKLPEPLPRAIDPEDIRAFLSVIEKPRDRAMFLLLLRTGMRIGELLNTRVEDVHLNEKRIDIVEAQKTRTGRVVYLSRDAEAVLRIWLKQRDPNMPYLFYGQLRSHDRIGYTGVRGIFVKYIKKSGLSHKGYTIHCLRHTFASELLNAGMRLECLQQLLGHECIEMTRRYARLTDITRKEEYFKAMDKIEKGDINGSYQRDSELPAVY
jgi:integrase/recombinase XerD